MPELPEVETTKNGIKDAIITKAVSKITIRQYKLRWPIPPNLSKILCGQSLCDIRRRAKYLLLDFTDGSLIMHLGMSGNLRILPQGSSAKKHDHVDIVFDNTTILRYHDPRRFGCILWCEHDPLQHRLLCKLGVEPLEQKFNSKYLFSICNQRRCNIKQTIMNANLVVGVGNIYASEALHLSGIHPLSPASSISRQQCQQLCKHIKRVLRKSIKAGGTTLKDFNQADGKPGYFSQQLQVYGRDSKPCNTCGGHIEKIIIGQRSSFLCPNCQPLCPPNK